jgi:phycocyanin-associated rod protein
MLGQAAINGRSSSSANNRVFVYEVTGLRQNQENDANDYAFRSSSSVFFPVPYSRMNDEMQRIGKMGGTIVNIQPLEAFKAQQANSSTDNVVTENNSSDHHGSSDDNDNQDRKSNRKKKKGFKDS